MDRVRVMGPRRVGVLGRGGPWRPKSVSRRWGAVSAALVVGVVGACGSTVQVSGEEGLSVLSRGGSELGVGGVDGAQSGSDGRTAQVPGDAGGDGTSSGPDSSGAPGESGAASRSAGSSKGEGARTARPAGSGKGPAGSAPGVTDKTIKVGVYTIKGYGKFASSAGVDVSTGDQQVQAQAVIDYINGKGGVAGRKIVPVYHDFNTANIDNPSQEAQAACSAWTEDDRVYAVTSVIGTVNDNLYACLAKKGVMTSAAGGEFKDARFFAQYADFFYMPTDINLTRALGNNVEALAAGGYFGKWDNVNGRSGSLPMKIGVIRADTVVDQRAVNEGLKPALAKRGLSVAEEFAVPPTTSGYSAYSSAVLRFKQSNVTHVIFGGLATPLLFGEHAEKQQYRPRYGLISRHSAAVLQSTMSPAQLRGSMGLGWNQYNDVDSRRDPGPPSDRASLCLKLMKQAGEDTGSRSTVVMALWVCDSIFFVRDALRRAPNFAPAGFRAGAEALSSYDAASTFRSGLARGKLHDAAKAYRLFAFKDSCKCFDYATGVRPTR